MCLAICVTPALQFEHLCLFGETVCCSLFSLSLSLSLWLWLSLHHWCKKNAGIQGTQFVLPVFFLHVAKVALPVSGAGKHCCDVEHTRAQTHMPILYKHTVAMQVLMYFGSKLR